MVFILNTEFSDEEKFVLNAFLNGYDEALSVFSTIESDKLNGISVPNRMISVGGLFLCEEKDEPLSWYMGQKVGEIYDFWGKYGDLQNTLESL